ncbi:MAG: tRNA pseudouridine synthase A [Lapillicoccus sp.]
MDDRGDLVRLRLDLAYDGTDFSGWAAQPGLRTVEGTLSAAMTTVLRAGAPVRLVVAGRTDAGVHARGQVAHADVDPRAYAALAGRSDRTPADALRTRLTGLVGADLAVRAVTLAPEGFDARFSATARHYLYRLADDRAQPDPLRRRDTATIRGRLDDQLMTLAADRLVGLHDFAPFCRRREGATTIRTLLGYRWARLDDGVVVGSVVADAFCHSMVRALVGAVVPVGQGRRDVGWPSRVLAAGHRDAGVRVMPAHGLSLEAVDYPPDAELATRAQEARAVRSL